MKRIANLFLVALLSLAIGSPALAQKISADPTATTLSGSEYLAGVQSGANVKILPSQIATLTLTGPSSTGKFTTQASGTGTAGFRLPHGAAPTSPVDGDMWTTSAGGLYIRINGATIGPLNAGGSGTVTHTAGSLTANQLVIGAGSADVAALGSLGTTTTVLHGNASGAPTFGAVNLATDVTGVLPIANFTTGTPTGSKFVRDDGVLAVPGGGGGSGTVTNTGGNLTANQIMLGAGTVDSKVLGSLGTTAQVLQGNAAGAPTWGAVDLTSQVTSVLPASSGGTGSGSYSTGDLLYASSGSALSRRAVGSAGNVLTVSSGVPTWVAPASLSLPINAQTGTSYAIVATDNSKHLTVSNAASIAGTIAQAGTTGFGDGFAVLIENLGVGTFTITPTTSAINGVSALKVYGGQKGFLLSDGSNYRFVQIPRAGIEINSQTGTSYTVLGSDNGKILTTANASAIAVTVTSSALGADWFVWLQNTGAGTATYTPSSGTIDGASTLALPTGSGCLLAYNGSNYFTAARYVSAGGGGGGLANWTDAISTSSPNASVNAASLTPTGAGSSIAAIIPWKGTGYFAVQVPDGTTTGGNSRGSHSVDFQNTRSAAANVAGGTRTALLATNDAKATGTNSAVIASDRGTVAGDQTLVTGSRHTSTGSNTLMMGNFGTDRGQDRVFVRAYSSNTQGEAQTIHYGLLNSIAYSSTPKNITIAAGAASSTSIPILTNNSMATFLAFVNMGNSGAAQFLGAKIEGVIKRGANAAATALVGTPTITYLGRTAGTATTDWTVDAVADTTNGGLLVRGIDSGASGIVNMSADVQWVFLAP